MAISPNKITDSLDSIDSYRAPEVFIVLSKLIQVKPVFESDLPRIEIKPYIPEEVAA